MLVEREDAWDTPFAAYVIRDGIPRITRNILPKRVKIITAATQNIPQNLKIKNEAGSKPVTLPYDIREEIICFTKIIETLASIRFPILLLSLEIFKIPHLIILGFYIFQYNNSLLK